MISQWLRRPMLVPVALTLVVPVTARGQGIPDRVAALETTVANLQSINSTLLGQITALQGQVTGLKTRVSTLESGNTALQSTIATLQNQLSGLQNRQKLPDNTVTGLQNQKQVYVGRGIFSPLLGAGFSIVQSISVSAGSYLVYAIIPAVNEDRDDLTGECFLSTAGQVGSGIAGGAAAIERIRGFGFSSNTEVWHAQLPLLDVASFASDTSIRWSCTGFNSIVNPTLVAVSVGGINPGN
jgi:hypothetical protein